MPILVGALGALMLRVAGELADGTIATSCDEGAIERVIVPGVTTAAAGAGRRAPRVGTVLAICVTDAAGLDAAREQMTAHFSTYERIPRYAAHARARRQRAHGRRARRRRRGDGPGEAPRVPRRRPDRPARCPVHALSR